MNRLISIIVCIISISTSAQSQIYVTNAFGDLFALNVHTCTSQLIGNTGHGFGDIALTPDGKLWGIEGGILYQINTTNASSLLIGNTGIQGVSMVALNNGTLLIEYGSNLYGLNTDASSYLIGSIGASACGDLIWYDNDLYMTSCGSLIKIVLNITNTQILSVISVNPPSNPIPSCEGVGVAEFPGLPNSIIGFCGQDVWKICRIDGTFELICPGLIPAGMPGGTTVRLPPENPPSTYCDVNLSIKVSNPKVTNSTIPEFINTSFVIQVYDLQDDFFSIENNTLLNAFQIQIYDSSGMLAYESSNPNFRWRVDHLSDRIYYYVINYDNINLKKGRIVIVR